MSGGHEIIIKEWLYLLDYYHQMNHTWMTRRSLSLLCDRHRDKNHLQRFTSGRVFNLGDDKNEIKVSALCRSVFGNQRRTEEVLNNEFVAGSGFMGIKELTAQQ